MTRHCGRASIRLSACSLALTSAGQANTQLRIILDFLAVARARGRPADATRFDAFVS